jgi:iduronate 2-sulfatase
MQGEHGEWCKHTNFEYATRAPMMIHVPGLTDAGIVTTHYSEHVDLFPTLAEAAAGITLKPCPKGDASLAVALCTEGSSLVPLMRTPQTPVKTAAFSQYPRGYQRTPSRTNRLDNILDHMYTTTGSDLFGGELSTPSTSPCIMDREATPGCTMGYTIVTRLEGSEYRYTEWADFNTPGYELQVDWNRNVGIELYNHSSDPGENFNLNATQKGNAAIHSLSAKLSALLRAGPSYGNPGI